MHLNKTEHSSCLSYRLNSSSEKYNTLVGAQLEGKQKRNTKEIETSSTVNITFDLVLRLKQHIRRSMQCTCL